MFPCDVIDPQVRWQRWGKGPIGIIEFVRRRFRWRRLHGNLIEAGHRVNKHEDYRNGLSGVSVCLHHTWHTSLISQQQCGSVNFSDQETHTQTLQVFLRAYRRLQICIDLSSIAVRICCTQPGSRGSLVGLQICSPITVGPCSYKSKEACIFSEYTTKCFIRSTGCQYILIWYYMVRISHTTHISDQKNNTW